MMAEDINIEYSVRLRPGCERCVSALDLDPQEIYTPKKVGFSDGTDPSFLLIKTPAGGLISLPFNLFERVPKTKICEGVGR